MPGPLETWLYSASSLIYYPRTEISWGPDLNFPRVLSSVQKVTQVIYLTLRKYLRLFSGCFFFFFSFSFPFLAKLFRKHKCCWHCDIASCLAKSFRKESICPVLNKSSRLHSPFPYQHSLVLQTQ